MPAYSESYLQDAMENMAEMTWFVDRHTTLQLDEYWRLFLASGIAREFAAGSPRVVAGRSGVELAAEVFERTGYSFEPAAIAQRLAGDDSLLHGLPPAYWCGWVLAFIQWNSGMSFARLHQGLSFEWLLNAYPTLHETSELHVAQLACEHLQRQAAGSGLKRLRQLSGMSQSQLAWESGVGIRAIQQYEQGSKCINKASASALAALARSLHCEQSDLMEPTGVFEYSYVRL